MMHLVIMLVLHNIFSGDLAYIDEKHYLRYFHSCFLNGMANMLSNNGYVSMENNCKKGDTFIRHFTYDLVFLVENIALLTFGYTFTVSSADEHKAKDATLAVSCFCYVLAMLLKLFYYSKLHLWSDLIHVVQQNEDEKWIFETEYTWFRKTNRIERAILPSFCK